MKKPIEFETFRALGEYEGRNLSQENPDCFNGIVAVKKYKVTIEQVDELDSVVIARIKKLWQECNNLHYRTPLVAAAKEYGINPWKDWK